MKIWLYDAEQNSSSVSLGKMCVYTFCIYPCKTTTQSWKYTIDPRIRGEPKSKAADLNSH